jgi:hypothetical protein
MALGVRYIKTVVFVLGGEDSGSASLRGTGFVAGTLTEDPNIVVPFVVTTAHVVRTFPFTAVRLSRKDGAVEDRPIESWTIHGYEDIAVALLRDIDLDVTEINVIPVDQFIGDKPTQYPVAVGDQVYFGGLLGAVPSMGEANVPMIRTGAVGALYQAGVPMRLADDTVIHVRGHLVDCRSFGGFSGSPCFVRFISATGETQRMGLRYPIESTMLLGMVGGHFDLAATVELPDQQQRLSIPVSAGIGVVYPAELIAQLLTEAAAAIDV